MFVRATLFFIGTFWSWFVYAGSTSGYCQLRNPATKDFSQLAHRSCEQVRDSKACQDLYQKIREDGGDAGSKILVCEATSFEEISASYIGCLSGGWDASLGIFVHTAGALSKHYQENAERLRKCDSDPAHKTHIFKVYNQSVPKLLRVPEPNAKTLSQKSCAQIETDLYQARSLRNQYLIRNVNDRRFYKNQNFTSDEKEYFAWLNSQQKIAPNSSQSLAEMANKILSEYNIRTECYNAAAAAALRCEALFLMATGGWGAGKAALGALSGLKAARLEQKLQTLQALGREGRILKATNEISNLSETEKLQLLKSELGRSKDFTPKETSAIQKAHEEGANQGEFYGRYSGDTLREKKRILMQEGGFSETEADYMIHRGIVGSAGFSRDEYIALYKKQAEKIFGSKNASYAKAEAIIKYRESLVAHSGLEKKVQAEALARLKDVLSEAEYRAVVDGRFDRGIPISESYRGQPPINAKPENKPAVTPTQSVAAPSPKPAPPAQALDPIARAAVNGMNKDEAVRHADDLGRLYGFKPSSSMSYKSRVEMEETVISNTMDDTVQAIRKVRGKLENPNLPAADQEKLRSTLQSHLQKCRGMIPFSKALGFVGDSFQFNLERQIRNNCQD